MSENIAHAAFKILEHWQPGSAILPPEKLLAPSEKYYPLFCYLYHKTEALYALLPPRKNGEFAFIHPVNVVLDLQRANVQDTLTLCAGLIHDYVEEQVDMYKRECRLEENEEGLRLLGEYEEKAFIELERDLGHFCAQQGCSEAVSLVIKTVHLLTRHKRHFYYKSISQIFNCPDDEIKERAIQVKLADRAHNILCVECFNGEERIYQCFKNVFILNSAKDYIIKKHGLHAFVANPPVERLFNKCAKATYDAFLAITRLCYAKGIANVTSMIQLALRKYAFERGGLSGVTDGDDQEKHPLRLFQGIIRKYDARLHHEWATFEERKASERTYCEGFFADFSFSQEQLDAVIEYKDAYALKEVVAALLYQQGYVLHHFLCSELTEEGRIGEE